MSSLRANPIIQEDDPIELMLKRTGCMELHYKVQECINKSGDWRPCQEQVREFKTCMLQFSKTQAQKYPLN